MKKKTKIPIYYGSLTIYFCQEDSMLKDIEKEHDLDDTSGMDAFFFCKKTPDKYSEYFMVFTKHTTPWVIAHECVHFTNQLFMDTGIQLDPQNDEPYAYLLGWAVKQCHSAIDAIKKK